MAPEERRTHLAQREVVEAVLPEREDGSVLLRTADGKVLVYDEDDDVKRSTELRAVVLPDGEVLTPQGRRFRRD